MLNTNDYTSEIYIPKNTSFTECINLVIRHKFRHYNELGVFTQIEVAKRHFYEAISSAKQYMVATLMSEYGFISKERAAKVISHIESKGKYGGLTKDEKRGFEVQLSRYYRDYPEGINKMLRKFNYIGRDMMKPAQRVKKVKMPMATYSKAEQAYRDRKEPKMRLSANRDSVISFHTEYLEG